MRWAFTTKSIDSAATAIIFYQLDLWWEAISGKTMAIRNRTVEFLPSCRIYSDEFIL